MGDWLREEIEREYVVERDGWAAERVVRVMGRLHAGELATLVVWLADHNAFTSGQTIYFSRRLF